MIFSEAEGFAAKASIREGWDGRSKMAGCEGIGGA